jgi:glycosyltransferase involved in cell wall biosynthesis
MEISIIICCYNSEGRIGVTLEYLAKQILPDDVSLEVILVDNNCTDKTVDVAKEAWANNKFKLVILKESTPGPEAARRCGMKYSQSEYLLCCDDDNWLEPDYVANAYLFLNENSEYAAIGGWGDVVSDCEIPEWFEAYETKYACGKTGKEGAVDTLITAGLFLRRAAWKQLMDSGFQPVLSGRKGSGLQTGEDLELTLALRISGWKLYFSEGLYFKHYMPAGRLTEEYLIRMCHGHALSRPVISEYFRLLALKEGRSHWLHKIVPFFVLAVWRLLRSSVRVFGKRASDDLASSVDFAIESATNEQYRISLLSGQAFGLRKRVKKNVGL